MSKSYIAKYIDEEYKRKQFYKNRKRQPCKTKECTSCKFFDICTERHENFLNDMVEGFIKEMRHNGDMVK